MVDIWTTIFIGICNGLGTATGSYLATKYAIKHIDGLDQQVRELRKKKEEQQ